MTDVRPTRLELAWFAGFYEGDGTIYIDTNNSNRLLINIFQNDPTPLYKAQKFWGGTVVKKEKKSPASDKICTGYRWTLTHAKVLKFIEEIRPFMIIPYKINQLDSCLDIHKNKERVKRKCYFCDAVFNCYSNMGAHEKNVHLSRGQKYKCSLCDTNASSRSELNLHMKTHKEN